MKLNGRRKFKLEGGTESESDTKGIFWLGYVLVCSETRFRFPGLVTFKMKFMKTTKPKQTTSILGCNGINHTTTLWQGLSHPMFVFVVEADLGQRLTQNFGGCSAEFFSLKLISQRIVWDLSGNAPQSLAHSQHALIFLLEIACFNSMQRYYLSTAW